MAKGQLYYFGVVSCDGFNYRLRCIPSNFFRSKTGMHIFWDVFPGKSHDLCLTLTLKKHFGGGAKFHMAPKRKHHMRVQCEITRQHSAQNGCHDLTHTHKTGCPRGRGHLAGMYDVCLLCYRWCLKLLLSPLIFTLSITCAPLQRQKAGDYSLI